VAAVVVRGGRRKGEGGWACGANARARFVCGVCPCSLFVVLFCVIVHCLSVLLCAFCLFFGLCCWCLCFATDCDSVVRHPSLFSSVALCFGTSLSLLLLFYAFCFLFLEFVIFVVLMLLFIFLCSLGFVLAFFVIAPSSRFCCLDLLLFFSFLFFVFVFSS
jgi:hypothetical protein